MDFDKVSHGQIGSKGVGVYYFGYSMILARWQVCVDLTMVYVDKN